MDLHSAVLTGQRLDPGPGAERQPVATSVEVRWDPLTGHSARLVRGTRLLPPSGFDLAALAEQARPTCPFCPERIEAVTPTLPPAIHPGGRIRHGQALLFPNLLTYAQYSAVSVYGPALHHLPLAQLTGPLVADNLAAQVAFAGAVLRHDPDARWASINANHLLPSGSSVLHPHLQGGVNPFPTTMQRLLADVPAERFADYLATERRAGRRHLGSSGTVEWLAGFAPVGPGELRAFLPGVASPVELPGDRVEELAHGIATAANLYAELGYQSMNLALYGAPPATPGYPLNLRMVCRANLEPLYRSDVTYLERLHWEAATDLTPEDLADHAGVRFRR